MSETVKDGLLTRFIFAIYTVVSFLSFLKLPGVQFESAGWLWLLWCTGGTQTMGSRAEVQLSEEMSRSD